MSQPLRRLVRLMPTGDVPPQVPVRRHGVVAAVGTGTVDVRVAGVTVTGLFYLKSYASPHVGDHVIVDVNGSDLIVLGAL